MPNIASLYRVDARNSRQQALTAAGMVVRQDKRNWAIRLTLICLALSLFALLTPNPGLTVGGIAVVPILFSLLWKAGEPPVLLFAAMFQWLQVFAPVLTANGQGEVVGQANSLPQLVAAAWLSFAAIVAVAAGMWWGRGSGEIVDGRVLDAALTRLTSHRLTAAYLFTFVLGMVIRSIATRIPGLQQPLLPLASLRWAVVFLIGWSALRQSRFRSLALLAFATEIVLGFGGYFSGFKTVLFLGIVLIGASHVRIRRMMRPSLVVAILLAVVLTTFWQSIKVEYRYFLNQGERAQVILVPVADRIAFVYDRAANVSISDLRAGLDSGLDRLGYLEFFARSIQTVPARIPFQRGRLWREAFEHLITPRIFFPEKLAIDDSQRTSEYTGRIVAGAAQGASISIGYAGESYIDFGPLGMFVPIFFVGAFWGWSFRWMVGQAPVQLLGLAVATNLILGGAISFESSNIKLLGGAVMSIIVLGLLLRVAGTKIWLFLAPPVRPRVGGD